MNQSLLLLTSMAAFVISSKTQRGSIGGARSGLVLLIFSLGPSVVLHWQCPKTQRGSIGGARSGLVLIICVQKPGVVQHWQRPKNPAWFYWRGP
jgi:hypothetical protein